MPTELGVSIAFWVLTAVTVGAAAALVTTRSVFHAAIALVVTFFGIAGLYGTLSADFLAAVQILVYAGAVAIVMVFAIMMTHDPQHGDQPGRFQASAAIIAAALAVIIVITALQTAWPLSTAQPAENTPVVLAEQLLGPYVLPFEIVSVLLVAAMVGAIIIARER